MLYDGYKTVLNGEGTYREIAETLLEDYAIVFPWTDEAGTKEDILIVYRPVGKGSLGGGQNANNSLFVSVLRVGAFGFDMRVDTPKFPGYVGEKLNIGGENETTIKLAELINNVIKHIYKVQGKM